LGYAAAALVVYNAKGWGYLNEIVRIPLIEYLVAFAIAGLVALGIWVADRLKPSEPRGELVPVRIQIRRGND
jgi:hypothetical protein